MNCHKQRDKMKERGQGGYVMIEALVGVAVFAITLSGMAMMLAGSFKATENSKGIVEQTNIGSDVIENLLALPYDTSPALDPGAQTLAIDGIDDKYTVSYQVGQDTYLRNAKLISVTVTSTQDGVNKTTTLDYVYPDLP